MWMHALSPYRNIGDEQYAQIFMTHGVELNYKRLNEGKCSLCDGLARECIVCNALLCAVHYKEHHHEQHEGLQRS